MSSQRAVKGSTRLASPIPWRGHGGGDSVHPPSKKGRADTALDESLHIRSDLYCQGQCHASDYGQQHRASEMAQWAEVLARCAIIKW